MKLLKIFILFLFFNFSYAQLPLKEDGDKKKGVVPNPIDLKTTWYDYFEVDEVELESRGEDFIKRLDNIKNSLNISYQRDIIDLIERVESNFRIFLSLKKKVKVSVFKKKEFLKSYNLGDLLFLGEALFEEEKSYKDLKKQSSLEELAIKSKEKDVDRLTLLYFKETKISEEKLKRGLELIDSKFLLEIEKLKFDFLKLRLEEQNKILTNLKEEIDFARIHLVIRPTTKKEFDIQEEEIKNNIKKYQTEMELSRIFLAKFQGVKEKQREIDLEKQKLLNATILFFYNQISLINLEIEKTILEVEDVKKIENISSYYERIQNWQKSLDTIRKEIFLWEETVRFGLEKSLEKAAVSKDKRLSEKAVKESELSYLLIQKVEKSLFISDFLLDQLTYILKEKYATFKDRILLFWHKIKLFFQKRVFLMDEPIFKIGKSPVTLFGIFKFLLIIVISYFIAAFIRKYIKKIGEKNRKITHAAFYNLSRLVFYMVFFLGIIIAFVVLGIDFTAFAIVAGALGVGIGFGLQSVVSNFVAGIILLLEKNIRVRDFIELETGEKGTVKEINVRTTLIRTLDNLEILIPNSDLVGKKFINWTLSEKIRRVRIPFSVAFGSDKEFVKKVVVNAAKKVPTTLAERPIDIWLVKMAESSLNFELIVWVNEYIKDIPVVATKSRYLWAIESALVKNKIEIPYPVRDIRMKKNLKRVKKR
jgi:small-conductance mechanosensitive channel